MPESPGQSAPTQIANPCARLACWGCCKSTSILSSSLAVGAVFPECTDSCLSKLIVLQLGVVIEHGENKGFCCADTFCVLKHKRDLFRWSWELIDHTSEECPGVRSSGSPSFSCAALRKASFCRPAAAFCYCGMFSQSEELLTLSRSLLELLLLLLELTIAASFPQVP